MPDVKDKGWWLEHFEPCMVHIVGGGTCKKCGVWVPQGKWWDDTENFETHLKWHEGLEAKWSS